MKEKLLASRKRSDDSDDTEDEAAELESIDNSTPPGTAYVELLQMLNHDVLPGRAFYSVSFSFFSTSETTTRALTPCFQALFIQQLTTKTVMRLNVFP